ncbi:Receptor-type guanylate cyclase gcy [Seminavis robusta]|uniref:Receptor-type guanylate cyclase gcy n=1 Tax=Seminavis robusta TaxID=568900 RepID=A0A9N8HAR9_9STRA|nr:Receptor-type guanylate cyclase gcy [Seminavis robusta]|eukprot:Sro307_g113320.1 Receptor-type guanylate cyclase gcy (749) ;mRNA; r:41354-43958
MTPKEVEAKLKPERFINEQVDPEAGAVDSCNFGSNVDPNDDECQGRSSNHEIDQDELSMTSKETSRVRMLRVMVAGMLVMTGLVTAIAYYFLNGEEYQNFETAYSQFARTLGDAALEEQKKIKDALVTLATFVTTYAETNNLEWPFVLVPMFEASARNIFELCSTEYIGIQNGVPNEKVDRYLEFIGANYEDHVKESHLFKYGNLNLLDTNTSLYRPYFAKKAKEGTPLFPKDDDDRDVYWVRGTMQSPPMRSYAPMINLNIATIGNNLALYDSLVNLRYESLYSTVRPFTALPADEHAKIHTGDAGVLHPHTFVHHPIFERVHDPTSKIVSIITFTTAWDASMRNLLPDNVNGILCVIKNTCDQVFTYEVNGNDAFYLGDVDIHDPKYDDLEVMVDLSLHTHQDFSTTPGHCKYSMHIYPTDTFKKEYATQMPETFAVTVAATFALVAIVFFVYDYLVQRSNKELTKQAARSDRLVSSLFPRGIKEMILEQQDIPTRKQNKTVAASETTDSSIASSNNQQFSPMAQVYSNTTILFADLAGFTSWSSTRTPAEVFELLETLYSAFDAIAKRQQVYKVETIGDCYVAATGLPNPQQDHAVIMVKFAAECMAKMGRLMAELVEKLGEDTANLQMRVGLNSGPVTGGVLRGDKSRFQLFGDTMNTASRMESNGVAGCIHASQATADALTAAGRESWLAPREEKVVAKGKGELQTYFVSVPMKPERSSTTASIPDQKNLVQLHEDELGEGSY